MGYETLYMFPQYARKRTAKGGLREASASPGLVIAIRKELQRLTPTCVVKL